MEKKTAMMNRVKAVGVASAPMANMILVASAVGTKAPTNRARKGPVAPVLTIFFLPSLLNLALPWRVFAFLADHGEAQASVFGTR